MPSITDLMQQGSHNLLVFIPVAILLGALHGLEPGHSKTMMAAFIVSIRGTVGQAALLGLSAALSHTAVVWVVALGGQHLGRKLNVETSEPYFQLGSAVLVLGVALWMGWRTWRDEQARAAHDLGHSHDHGLGHDADVRGHDAEVRTIDTGHGLLALEVFEDGVPPRSRVRFLRGERFGAADVTIDTVRPHGASQGFRMVDRGDYLESADEIPEPHEFMVRVALGHGGHLHRYEVAFRQHVHSHAELSHNGTVDRGREVVGDNAYADAHEHAHADDIARRFAGRSVTTGQIVLFGLTGGLIPCPAAITVLLLCLQLQQIGLGVLLVLCFSVGLAVTMVTAGVVAALSMHRLQKRWSGFSAFAARAPYASSALMVLVACYMAYAGWAGLARGA